MQPGWLAEAGGVLRPRGEKGIAPIFLDYAAAMARAKRARGQGEGKGCTVAATRQPGKQASDRPVSSASRECSGGQ